MSIIKAIRERLGVTQSALAAGMRCTQGNVGHYERGQTVPPEAAKRLIDFARSHGLVLTMDQVYGMAPLPPLCAAPAQPPAPVDRRVDHATAAVYANTLAERRVAATGE